MNIQPTSSIKSGAPFSIGPQDFARVVDCSANPMDVRPLVGAAMEMLFAKIKECQKTNKKIVILFGEEHSMPTHIGAQQILLHDMFNAHAKGQIPKFAVGFERPHNSLEEALKYKGIHIPKQIHGHIAQFDRDGQESLKACTQTIYSNSAPASVESVMMFCRKHKISSRFTDLARYRLSRYLDPSDPFTASIIKKYASIDTIENDIHIASASGMALRNHGMVAQILDHTDQSKSDIFVQTMGAGHAYGLYNDLLETSEYKDSIECLLKQRGVEVVAIVPACTGILEFMPVEAQKAVGETGLLVQGLNEQTFELLKDLNLTPEREFLNRVFEQSGGVTQVLEAKDKGEYDVPIGSKAHMGILGFVPALPKI